MSVTGPLDLSERLRSAPVQRTAEVRPQDAEIATRPRFSWLLALGLAAIVLQSTLLRDAGVRGGSLSILTVLLVWAGLRSGPAAGGLLGLITGVVEDALGGGGANVLGTTLVGYIAGVLSGRFFADSLPVFVSAVAVATWLRGVLGYAVLAFGMGERGMWVAWWHALAWQTLLNCTFAVVLVLALRIATNLQSRRAVA